MGLVILGFCEGSSHLPPLKHMQLLTTPPHDPCSGFRLKMIPIDIPSKAKPITIIERKNSIIKITKKNYLKPQSKIRKINTS